MTKIHIEFFDEEEKTNYFLVGLFLFHFNVFFFGRGKGEFGCLCLVLITKWFIRIWIHETRQSFIQIQMQNMKRFGK